MVRCGRRAAAGYPRAYAKPRHPVDSPASSCRRPGRHRVRKRPVRTASRRYSPKRAGRRRLRARPPVARRALRRPLLHRRRDNRHLLPAGLPGPAAEGRQRPLLRLRGRRGSRRLSPLPAVPARDGAGHAGMERIPGHGAAGAAPDRRRGPRRCRRRRTGPATRRQPTASAPTLRPPRRRVAGTGRFDVPPPPGQTADRRHRPAVHRGRAGRRIRKRPPLQRRAAPGIRPHAARAAPSTPAGAGGPRSTR